MPAQVLMSPCWAREVNPQVVEDLLDELVYVWPYNRRLMSPLPEEGEDDDEDGSGEEPKEISGQEKAAVAPFNWSAASARVDRILPVETQVMPNLPAMTTVILSQEILTPKMDIIDTYHKEMDSFPEPSTESVTERPVVSPPRNISHENVGRRNPTKMEPFLQRTLIQIPKTEGIEEGEKYQEQTLPSPTSSGSASATTFEIPVSSTIVQVFWFLLVFLFVHHVLKVLRVGPILGFFGATGPEAIGYWSAMEAMVDFLLFRLF